ncbi:hypothetical protein CGCS363_v001617 [Colletotrichum siamense]|uniref:uncharacterized protein n=1 Tax=Colletotrichum siamense TaxID=690259 RepID=UPI001872BC42|nr:uncharacterized protein CGCS363_v001617 [Colletotrichum siamense]KAF5516564.1 hypothetical protein CGCS363_v001617 [Colletotrichum siamense]
MQILGTVLRSLARMETKPYPLDLVKGLEKYFDSPEYSDVTIRCITRDFYAHRVVLASQSKFFADAFPDSDIDPALLLEGSTVLGNANAQQNPGCQQIINLQDENPRVVENVLCFMYHADYRDTPCLNVTPPPADPILFNLQMSVAADKFEVSCLKRCAVEKLRDASEKLWNTDAFVKAIAYAYSESSRVDVMARSVLAEVAARHVSDLSQIIAFRNLLDEFLQFHVDFTEAVVKTEPDMSQGMPYDDMKLDVWAGKHGLLKAACDFGAFEGTMIMSESEELLDAICDLDESEEENARPSKYNKDDSSESSEDDQPARSKKRAAQENLSGASAKKTKTATKACHRIYYRMRVAETGTGDVDIDTRSGYLDFSGGDHSGAGYSHFVGFANDFCCLSGKMEFNGKKVAKTPQKWPESWGKLVCTLG